MKRTKTNTLIKELELYNNKVSREEALEFAELVKRITERQKLIDSII